MAGHFDDHRLQALQPTVILNDFFGEVDRADRAGFQRLIHIKLDVHLTRQLAEAVYKGFIDLVRRHRIDVFLEHRQLRGNFLRQEVRVGRRNLGHLDKKRAEFPDHAGDDLSLGGEILRVGLQERLDVTNRLDLSAQNHQVPTQDTDLPPHIRQPFLIGFADILEAIHQLNNQRLVGTQDQADDVEVKLNQALQFWRIQQFVEETPELINNALRHLDRTAGNHLPHQKANQPFGGFLIGNQAILAQHLGQRAGLHVQRVLIERVKQLVQRGTQLRLINRLQVARQPGHRPKRTGHSQRHRREVTHTPDRRPGALPQDRNVDLNDFLLFLLAHVTS